MNVIGMIGIGARPEHGHEAAAGRGPNPVAKRFCDLLIGQIEHAAVAQPDRGDIQRIAPAVLGNLRAFDAVAGAAIIGVIVGDR